MQKAESHTASSKGYNRRGTDTAARAAEKEKAEKAVMVEVVDAVAVADSRRLTRNRRARRTTPSVGTAVDLLQNKNPFCLLIGFLLICL